MELQGHLDGRQARTDFEGPAHPDAEGKVRPVFLPCMPIYEDVGGKTHLPAVGQHAKQKVLLEVPPSVNCSASWPRRPAPGLNPGADQFVMKLFGYGTFARVDSLLGLVDELLDYVGHVKGFFPLHRLQVENELPPVGR